MWPLLYVLLAVQKDTSLVVETNSNQRIIKINICFQPETNLMKIIKNSFSWESQHIYLLSIITSHSPASLAALDNYLSVCPSPIYLSFIYHLSSIYLYTIYLCHLSSPNHKGLKGNADKKLKTMSTQIILKRRNRWQNFKICSKEQKKFDVP